MITLKNILLILLVGCCYKLNAQTTVQGNVTDQEGRPVEFFDAIIRNVPDSSMVKAGAFLDGKFEFHDLKKGKYILQLSSVGYITAYIHCNTEDTNYLHVGTTKLSSLTLDEVRITVKRPVITRKEGNLLIDVMNSSLGNTGTSIDVLQRSPGVIVDNQNNITVLGKGTPVVFINDKEVNSTSELELLQSGDIDKIEINRNPSAEYSASGHAVIKITTKKITKENLNILIYTNPEFGRKYSQVSGFNLNSRIKKISNYASYSYSDHNYRYYHTAYENNYLPSDTIHNNNSDKNKYHKNSHNIFYGLTYDINGSNNIGFQLSSYLSKTNESTYVDETIKNKNTAYFREIDNTGNGTNNFYDFNLNYKSTFDSLTTFSFIMDYAGKILKNTDNIAERNIPSVNETFTQMNNSSVYDVFSGKIDFERVFFKHWKTKTGARYTFIENDSKNSIQRQGSVLNITNSITTDRVFAGYASIKRQLGKFTAEAGIRYEHTFSNTQIIDSVDEVIKKEYDNFFPSVLLSYKHSDNFIVSLSYSERISRPSFYEINPKINYFDSLSYGIGNPLIKPTLSHNFELGFTLFSNLSVTINYTKESDKRIQVATNDEDNPHIIKYIHTNIDNGQSVSAGVSYNFTKKFFTNYTYFSLDKPYIEIPYLSTTRKIRKPIWYFQTINEFILVKNTVLHIDFNYESEGETNITYWKETYDLSAGIYTKLLDNKLLLSLDISDILKTYTHSWHDRYINIESGEIADMDTRRIEISIKYNFNQFKNIFDVKSSNQQDLRRL